MCFCGFQMSAERFFIEHAPDRPGDVVALSRDESHHLKDVRRVDIGGRVVLFDGSGTDYVGRVAGLGRDGVTVEIVEVRANDREAAVAVTLAVSVVKAGPTDQLVNTCTQLGMRRLVPIITERSVVKPGANRIERWRRIAITACKQCGRSIVPEIELATSFADVLESVTRHEVAVIASMGPDAQPLLAAMPRACRTALCLIGPEGGFTDEEESAATDAGCLPVSLSRSILRTETAAAAALAIIGQAAGS